MAQARAAIGYTLSRNGTPIALLSDIDGPGLKGDTIEVTNHNNPDNHKEFIVGLLEGGDLKVKIYYDPLDSTHQGLVTAMQARTMDTWVLTPPAVIAGAPSWTFSGYLTQFDTKAKVKDAIEADVTVKVSGKPVLA